MRCWVGMVCELSVGGDVGCIIKKFVVLCY